VGRKLLTVAGLASAMVAASVVLPGTRPTVAEPERREPAAVTVDTAGTVTGRRQDRLVVTASWPATDAHPAGTASCTVTD